MYDPYGTFFVSAKANFALKQSTENKPEPPTPQRNFLKIIWDSMSYKEIQEPEVDTSLINNFDKDRVQPEIIPAQGIISLNFSMIFVPNLNFL